MKSVVIGITVVIGAFLGLACPEPPADLWNQVQAQYQNLPSFSAEILTIQEFPDFFTSVSETFIFCFPFVRWSLDKSQPAKDLIIMPQEILRIENIQTGQAWVLYDNSVWEKITDEPKAGRHQPWLERLGIQDLMVEEVSAAELDGKQFWLIKGWVKSKFGELKEAHVFVDCNNLLITRVDLKSEFFMITKIITNFSLNVEVDPELFAPPPDELITQKTAIVPEGRTILARVLEKLKTLESFTVQKRVEELGASGQVVVPYEQVVVYRYPFLRNEIRRLAISFVTIIDFSAGVIYSHESGRKRWTKDEFLHLHLEPAFYTALFIAFSLLPAAYAQPVAVEEETWHGWKVWRIVGQSFAPQAPQPEWWVDQETLAIFKYVEPTLICGFEGCWWTKNTVTIVSFAANPEIPAELFALPAQAEERRVPKLPDRPKLGKDARDLPLNWEPFSFERLEEAKAQGKGVVLFFTADWCEPCHRLEAGPLRNPKVQKLLSPFVLLKVDLTRLRDSTKYTDELRKVVITFRVDGLPTLVFLSPEGKEIGRIMGYSPAVVAEIQEILEGGK